MFEPKKTAGTLKSSFLPIAVMAAVAWLPLSGCDASGAEPKTNLGRLYLSNDAAAIPPQCYTRTERQTRTEPQARVERRGETGRARRGETRSEPRGDAGTEGAASNPCYVCHTESTEPNYTNDVDLQLEYSFPKPALTNHWSNLFKDRSAYLASVSDEAILAYVREDNYRDPDGRITLASRLTQNLPSHWDGNRNGQWDGYVPDVGYHFDERGFDHDAQGRLTGWRALAYTPFPGTFFPTNGSTDDVLIRLPEIYRHNEAGEYDETVYRVNLAIVEALIKRQNVAIEPVDENALHVDLDGNGTLGIARQVVYDWAPLEKRFMHYVGQARLAQRAGQAPLAAGLYPLGTEFVHSVRYLDINESGKVVLAARMKELRYARKASWRTYYQHRAMVFEELKDAHDFPDRLEAVIGDIEVGVSNRRGWRYSGFIENREGRLRPQSYEELATCVGCHGAIGGNVDGSFALPRKLDAGSAFQHGWYHWRQKGMVGIPEPRRRDGSGEYAFYLQQVGNADEYRGNRQVRQRFFNGDGTLKETMLAALSEDISVLILPSRRRALDLDKAYQAVVKEQSYSQGRDAVLAPRENVWKRVPEGQTTGVREPVTAH